MTNVASFIPAPTIRDALNNNIALAQGPTASANAQKIALFTSSFAGGVMLDDPATYAAGSYNANETSGGSWASGGVALTAPVVECVDSSGVVSVIGTTHTSASGVGINFIAGNVSQVTSTVTNANCGAIYDTTISPNCVLCVIGFNGNFTATSGTFAITWGTANTIASIFYITLHA